MEGKDSKCNRRGRTIKKPKKYCTTDSDKPTSKKMANSEIFQEMIATFNKYNSEESTDAPSHSSDNEYNFSTDSDNNVEMDKRSPKNTQSARKKENQDKPIAKPDRKKEVNQEKTLKPTSEQQLRHHENKLNSSGCSTQHNLFSLQNNCNQGDDVMRTSNNHSVYDFNAAAVVETSTVQKNSSKIGTCNYYVSPAITSNNGCNNSWSTSSMNTNAASVPPTGTVLDNTHTHSQFYNYHNNNDGHISYPNSENAILNNLRASQESFFQKFEEKMNMFWKTQERYVSKKVDDMQNYYEQKMNELKTHFNTKLDNMQVNMNANNNDRTHPVYTLPEGFPLQNMQQFEEFEKNEQKQEELINELASHFKWAQKSNKESNKESENEENEPASHRTLYDTQLSKIMFHTNEFFHKNTEVDNRPKHPSLFQPFLKKRLKQSRIPFNPVNLNDTKSESPEKKIGWDCWECRE
ncbi:PREDICTED: TBC1 domain family member 5 homolog A-like, partial [Vollenhovia emeryi]|uniref:TBC1 domain family member 5 homolog A-like n=1 Tax=Vollenhovia emeryi TaxID=411798 RepID=UPI0005F3892E